MVLNGISCLFFFSDHDFVNFAEETIEKRSVEHAYRHEHASSGAARRSLAFTQYRRNTKN